jgi:hypothetical protein
MSTIFSILINSTKVSVTDQRYLAIGDGKASALRKGSSPQFRLWVALAG